MTYQSKDLSVLAYANGFTLWHYTTEDSVHTPGYFNRAADLLRVCDIVVAVTSGDEPRAALMFVTENSPTGVKVRSITT